jgi:hypothetical protein
MRMARVIRSELCGDWHVPVDLGDLVIGGSTISTWEVKNDTTM